MSFRTAYGYSRSENGWRMCNRDECSLGGVAAGLPYTDTAPIRSGDASTILVAWMAWYHRNVEPIGSPVWGWSRDNDVATSNHLSGTAIDINAPKYPWGARVMPADRIARVRRGLSLFEGTVFWGADWGRADEMHYQIGLPEGDARIAAFARKLTNGHLGIYSGGTGEDEMPALEETFRNHRGELVTVGTALHFMDRHINEIREQLGGPQPFKGWPQLNGKTVVDSLADAHSKIDRIVAAVEATTSPGKHAA